MAAPAAGGAAIGVEFVVGLWLLVAVLVAMGLKAGWAHSIGLVLQGLASRLKISKLGVRIDLGKPLVALDDFVQDSLGRYILANEQAIGLWWHANTQIVNYLGDTLADFAAHSYIFGHNVVHGTIPATVAAHVKPVRDATAHANRATDLRTRAETRARVQADRAAAHELDTTFGRARAGIDAVLPRAKAYTDARVNRVAGSIAAERAYSHRILNRRLTWVEKALGVGALGGIAIASLTRVFPYWQCTGFRRFSRLLCRAPLGALEDFLGLALLLVGPVSIVQLTRELQGVMEPVVDGVHYFVHE